MSFRHDTMGNGQIRWKIAGTNMKNLPTPSTYAAEPPSLPVSHSPNLVPTFGAFDHFPSCSTERPESFQFRPRLQGSRHIFA